MRDAYAFTFTDEPPTTEEFNKYLEFLGSFSPPAMTEEQLKMLICVMLRNYARGKDIEDFDIIALDAATMALEAESAHQLNLAVGPEDGIH